MKIQLGRGGGAAEKHAPVGASMGSGGMFPQKCFLVLLEIGGGGGGGGLHPLSLPPLSPKNRGKTRGIHDMMFCLVYARLPRARCTSSLNHLACSRLSIGDSERKQRRAKKARE